MEIINNHKTRIDLADYFALREAKIIAEIGVEQGEYTEVICEANPEAVVYAIDAWKAYEGYKDHTRQDKLNAYYEATKQRLESYKGYIIRQFSMEAVKNFSDGVIDAVYIDANHSYESVLEDITEWMKKVKEGGIVSGHDYARLPDRGNRYRVIDAVNDYCIRYGIDKLTIWDGDEIPSWSFIKP